MLKSKARMVVFIIITFFLVQSVMLIQIQNEFQSMVLDFENTIENNNKIFAQKLQSQEERLQTEMKKALYTKQDKIVDSDKITLSNIIIPYKNTSLQNKTYMSIGTITNQTSPQWQYLTQQECISTYVDKNGIERMKVNNDTGFVMIDEYYGVAMGSYFDGDSIGTKYLITLDTNIQFKVVKVELKADKDTCNKQFVASSNDVIEFVIDLNQPYMQNNIGTNGLVFNGNFNNCELFKGNIIKIDKIIERE